MRKFNIPTPEEVEARRKVSEEEERLERERRDAAMQARQEKEAEKFIEGVLSNYQATRRMEVKGFTYVELGVAMRVKAAFEARGWKMEIVDHSKNGRSEEMMGYDRELKFIA